MIFFAISGCTATRTGIHNYVLLIQGETYLALTSMTLTIGGSSLGRKRVSLEQI
jgi:hypothetical protein